MFLAAADISLDEQEREQLRGGSIDIPRAGSLWIEAFGRLTYDANAPHTTPDTIFDLSSLTKFIATTSIAILHLIP